MTKIELWYRPINCGDGSANIYWYLTQEEAEWSFNQDYEGFSEDGIRSVETYEGADIHLEAQKLRLDNQKSYFLKDKDMSWEKKYDYIMTENDIKEAGMLFLTMEGNPDEWDEDEDE